MGGKSRKSGGVSKTLIDRIKNNQTQNSSGKGGATAKKGNNHEKEKKGLGLFHERNGEEENNS